MAKVLDETAGGSPRPDMGFGASVAEAGGGDMVRRSDTPNLYSFGFNCLS